MGDATGPGMRQRKKQQTRQKIIETAYRLFDERGYERTTVTDIAHAVDVSVGTFFNYFPAKEDVVFSEGTLLDEGLRIIADRRPDEPMVDLLTRAIRQMTAPGSPRDPRNDLEITRLRLIMSVPALQAAMLQRLFDAQERLADALRAAYPSALNEIEAVALTGAVLGARLAAIRAVLAHDDPREETVEEAVDTVTRRLRTAWP